MHKDPNLRKRNALAIPGGLLVFYSLVGMLYVVGARGNGGTCEDAALVVFAGDCRPALLVLAIPFILGLALLLIGLLVFRNKATCRHGHGSGTHFTLALLISFVVLPGLGALLAEPLLGENPVIVNGGIRYGVVNLLLLATGAGLLGLLPFVGLYVGQAVANPCCKDKGCFAPCFCDEPEATAEAAEAQPEAWATQPPAEPWPAESAAEAPPEAIEAAPEPAAEPQWETVPEEPQWEEEPVAAEPEPVARAPRDPATPPSDAMAVAAKWAEEDEQAKRDLAAGQPRTKKAAKPSGKAPAKKAPKSAKKR
jgi:hypothetical protein